MQKLEKRFNEVWLIWPEDAKAYLEHNHPKNRKISKSKVLQYVNDMENDRWADTPFPIIFTKDGVLLNGQHRLTAVVEVGSPCVFEVRIVPDDSILEYLDNGKSRTVTDYIATKEKNIVSAVSTFAYAATYGDLTISAAFQGKMKNIKKGIIRAGRIELAEYVEAHKEGFELLAKDARAMYTATKCGGSKIYACVLWLIKMLNDIEVSDEFVEEFCKGVPDDKSVSAVRTAIMREYTGTKTKPSMEWVMGVLFSAYEAYADRTGQVRFPNWKKTFDRYEESLKKWRTKKAEGYENIFS